MQRRITTNLISGAFLALVASVAPNANACSVPGMNVLRMPVIMPPAMFAPHKSAGAPAGSPVSIVGLWHVKFTSGGALIDDAFDVWHSDGTEVLNDFTDPIEDNVCLGVWTQTGANTYKLKHPSWTFDTSGNLTGTAWIQEAVTLSSDGSEYGGSYSITFFDTAGNNEGTYTGDVKGERITAD